MSEIDFPPGADPVRRLCYLMHWGVLKARLAASAEGDEYFYHLANALHNVPGYLVRVIDGDPHALDRLAVELRTFESKTGEQLLNYLTCPEAEVIEGFKGRNRD